MRILPIHLNQTIMSSYLTTADSGELFKPVRLSSAKLLNSGIQIKHDFIY